MIWKKTPHTVVVTALSVIAAGFICTGMTSTTVLAEDVVFATQTQSASDPTTPDASMTSVQTPQADIPADTSNTTSSTPDTSSDPTTLSVPAQPADTTGVEPAAITAGQPTSLAPSTVPDATESSATTPVATDTSPTSLNQSTDPSTSLDATTTTQATNTLDSTATTGDASVTDNTTAGSATTGNASASATIITTVNSLLSTGNAADLATFVANITGSITGDVTLQPMILDALQKAASTQGQPYQAVNATTTNAITNTVDLSAQSGDATVARNTTAGDATTGSAMTMADILNVINSIIAASQSFVGTINIFGNLNGDILTGQNSTLQPLTGTSVTPTGSSLITTDTQTVVNNVNLSATSGTATVDHNSSAGNATTGDATTNLVLLNLTNHAVSASNGLLVLINVIGSWVGMIVDTPVGATTAALGEGVTQDAVPANHSQTVTATTSTLLTNNVTLTSTSGNATVVDNTKAGSATSGNAVATVSIANIINTQIGLSGWFGVLFINVFGNWVGSFGVDTSAGNPVVPIAPPASATIVSTPVQPPQVLSYIPRIGSSQPSATLAVAVLPADDATGEAVAVSAPLSESQPTAPVVSSSNGTFDFAIPIAIGSLILVFVSGYILRRYL